MATTIEEDYGLLDSKDDFYSYISQAVIDLKDVMSPEQIADLFADNPYDVSYQEILGMTTQPAVAPVTQTDETAITPTTTPEGTETATPTYINPTSEELADINKAYDLTKTNVEKARADGLISVQQAKDILAENRDSLITQQNEGLSGNRAYFGAVSPDAYQSQIGTYNTKVKDAYQSGSRNLDRTQQNIKTAEENIAGQYNTDIFGAEQAYNAAIKPTATGGYDYNYAPNLAPEAAPTQVAAGVDPRSLAANAINRNIVGWTTGAPMSTSVTDYNSTPFDEWFNK